MKRILVVVLALTVVILVSVYRQGDEFSESDRTAIRDTVRQTLEQYVNDIRTGGLMTEFKYLDISPDFFWVPPGYTSALSYDSVAIILKANAGLFSSIDHRWETLRVNPLHGTLAAYTGTLHSITVDTSGNKADFRMIESGVVVKRSDGWKILCGQSRVLEQ